MSEINPYTPAEETSDDFGIRKVRVRPIQSIQRGFDLIGDKYFLFMGITLAGLLIGSFVPMGIIFGAMLSGIYFCFMHQEQGLKVEFGMLFRGFEYFKESFIAWLVMFAASLLVVVPFMIAMIVIVMMPILQNAGAGGPPPQPEISPSFFIVYGLFLVANFFIYIPFLFVFQLLVDRNVTAMTAIRLSFRGVLKNVWGILGFHLIMTIILMFLSMLCYIPAFFFLPIWFAAMYVVYRDIYGPGITLTAAPPQAQGPATPNDPFSGMQPQP